MSSNCPRCGAALGRFRLGGAEALSCEGCGYVGVPVDHSGEPTTVESWEAAIQRFERSLARDDSGVIDSDDDPEATDSDDDEAGETDSDDDGPDVSEEWRASDDDGETR